LCIFNGIKQITFTKDAARDLCSVPHEIELKIIAKLKIYAETPLALVNNVKAVQGKKSKGLLRLRVGDWRVIFSESGEVIAIESLGRRGDVYRFYY